MDAHRILGVAANAPEAEVRAAYLAKVKEFPPDRAPAEFERIRDAYDTLRDPRKRARTMFSASEPLPPLVSLIEGRRTNRIFAGPQPWREVLSGNTPRPDRKAEPGNAAERPDSAGRAVRAAKHK